MAQENNTAREQTALEKLSQDALNQARRERKMIQDTCIAELAQCDTEIPDALEKQVQAEIASLQQAKENLSSAHKIASSTVDELSARAADVAKSLNRKWYRINPPSNTAIDVQEEERSFFARGMNGYKIALIVFNTAREQTALEKLSQDALNQARRERKMIQDTCIAELAQCDTEIPDALEKQVQAEIASLQQAKENLSSAHKIASSTVDELSARAADVAKSLNRKWYRINPPSNTAIDVQEEERSFFARGMNGYKIALIVFIGSFAGVMLELLWCFARHGYLESRSGLVWGPFNMLYGVGAASLSIILYRFRNRGKWLSFLGGFVVGSVVEYVCSWLQEVLFGSRSWDYSRVPFNINGRICLLYSLFWGALGIFWIKDIYPFMAKWILKLPNRAGKILTWVLSIFLAVNCLVSAAAVYRWSERLHDEPPKTWIGSVMDARFPNERMERIYANMNFGDSE